MCHERFHETAQDHGVGHVGALELVEAEDRRAFGNASCHEWNCVDVVAVLHLHLVEVFVYALHECVKMYTGLARDVWWECVEEQIHHHGLA